MADAVGLFFASFISIIFLLTLVYSLLYIKHEGGAGRFYVFFTLSYLSLMGLCFSGNLVTLYVFFEFLTLSSFMLVLHNESHEAVMGSLKYLFYSMFGAYMALFGIFVLNKYCVSLDFTAGGTLDANAAAGHEALLLTATAFMLVGFGAKAGMFPLHAWLPTAHPVAPSPASAFLSGVIVKAGVLATIRVVFFTIGPDLVRGTWVQTLWMSVSLFTILMGSLLAYREKAIKKRLAYSTVSQVSYILFGLSLLTGEALTGALLHSLFHAVIKTGLFMVAGIFLMNHISYENETRGIGRKMPLTMWSYTLLSLALIGIPPACGFISKWHLALGALESGAGIFSYLGPAALLVSALLTAAYLLPVSIGGFFDHGGEPCIDTDDSLENDSIEDEPEDKVTEVKEAGFPMLIPVMTLSILSIVMGLLPSSLSMLASVISTVLIR
mgnify:CR=1 FL=1